MMLRPLFFRLLPWLLVGLAACDRSNDAPEPLVPEPVQFAATQNVQRMGEIYTAGQPDEEGLALAREAGVRTVVNLRHPSELGTFAEADAVEALGLEYVNVPFGSAEELNDDIFDRTRQVLSESERPLLLHCGSANRVGAVWIPWRVLDGGLELEAAVEEARAIGLRTEALEAKARDYVERHR